MTRQREIEHRDPGARIFLARILGGFGRGGEKLFGFFLAALAHEHFGEIVACDWVIWAHAQNVSKYGFGFRVLATIGINLAEIRQHARTPTPGSERSRVKDFLRRPITAANCAAYAQRDDRAASTPDDDR